MKRSSIFLYGVLCYVLSLVTFVYTFAFVGDLWLANSLDSARSAPLLKASLIDLALLTLFALQHSVMARPAFKRWWTGIVPAAA